MTTDILKDKELDDIIIKLKEIWGKNFGFSVCKLSNEIEHIIPFSNVRHSIN